jgi:receptor-type tyrosine-protein phosphatase N
VLDDGLDALLDEYDALDRGFKRRERLDVKKPGPFFSTNNYAFQHAASEEQDVRGIREVSERPNE